MNVIIALGIIFACLAVGEALTAWLGLTLPGSIAGMLIFAALLKSGIVKEHRVKSAADFLVRYMSVFFIPPGVGLICYFGLIRAQWLPIVVASTVSAVLVLLCTAVVYKLFLKKGQRS